jgi:hypothetical protein
VFDQPVRTDLWVRAVDLTLVAERLTGFLFWRIEARTRMSGPDYFTLFPIGGPDRDA